MLAFLLSFQKNGQWRARQESIPLLYDQLSNELVVIETDALMRLLRGEALEPEIIYGETTPSQGALLMRCHHPSGTLIINGWCGTRITLTLDKAERRLLSIRLGLEEGE